LCFPARLDLQRRPKQSLTSPSGKKLPAALQRIAGRLMLAALVACWLWGHRHQLKASVSAAESLAWVHVLSRALPDSLLPLLADNPGAMEAVQAVDAAAEELPPFNEETVKFMAETMYGGGRAPDEPPQRGIKVSCRP
jgi:hypothetical protein